MKYNKLNSSWNKGKKMSVDFKEKARLRQLGKKHSEESKNKLSKIAKERGFGKWMIGRTQLVDKKTREKMSETRKRLGLKPPSNKGKRWGIWNVSKEKIRESNKKRNNDK